MRMIDFSPKAMKQFRNLCGRLDPPSQIAFQKLIKRVEKKVVVLMMKEPEEKYHFAQGFVTTLLYDYEITVAGWVCECCNKVCTEVIHIEEYHNLVLN